MRCLQFCIYETPGPWSCRDLTDETYIFEPYCKSVRLPPPLCRTPTSHAARTWAAVLLQSPWKGPSVYTTTLLRCCFSHSIATSLWSKTQNPNRIFRSNEKKCHANKRNNFWLFHHAVHCACTRGFTGCMYTTPNKLGPTSRSSSSRQRFSRSFWCYSWLWKAPKIVLKTIQGRLQFKIHTQGLTLFEMSICTRRT